MLLDFSTYAAYMCPYCGAVTELKLSIFDIPAGGMKLNCRNNTCAAEVASIVPKGDKYVIRSVCASCEEQHSIRIKQSSFWQRKTIDLNCPVFGAPLMCFGSEEETEDFADGQYEAYKQAEEEICSSPELRIYFDIIREVNRIAKNDGVICSGCGANNAQVSLTDDGILIVCRSCGAGKLIGINNEAYETLLDSSTIVLE